MARRKSVVEGITDFLFGDDEEEEAEEKAKYKRAKDKLDAQKDFAYKGFIKTYGKALKDTPKMKHKKTPLQDLYKDVRDILNEYDHVNSDKIRYTRNNILSDNLGKMRGLSPKSQGIVISQLDSRFRVGEEEIQEEPTRVNPQQIQWKGM